MISATRRLPASLILSLGLSLLGGCAEKGKRDGRFDDDEVVAVVGSTEIIYGQIKFKYSDHPELRKAQELEASETPENFRYWCRFQERMSLQSGVFNALIEAGIRKYTITVSEREIEERAKETMAEQLASTPDIEASWREAVEASRLMCMWVEDKKEAEAAYQSEFKNTISKAEWERMKARVEAGYKPHNFTVEDIKAGARKAHLQTARYYCSVKRLVARLVELGELEEGQNIKTWCWRQLSTVEFPVEELKISSNEKESFGRWNATPRPRTHEGAAAERSTRADREEE